MYLTPEEVFEKDVKEIVPILERISQALKSNGQMLANQRFRIDANHQELNQQRAEIAANKEVIETRTKETEVMIKAAEDRRKEVERTLTERLATINNRDRESKKLRDEADKILWKAKDKVAA